MTLINGRVVGINQREFSLRTGSDEESHGGGRLYEVDPALPLVVALLGVAPLLLALMLVRRYVLRLAPLMPEPIPVLAT